MTATAITHCQKCQIIIYDDAAAAAAKLAQTHLGKRNRENWKPAGHTVEYQAVPEPDSSSVWLYARRNRVEKPQ